MNSGYDMPKQFGSCEISSDEGLFNECDYTQVSRFVISRRYKSRAVEAAQVIEELIELVREMREAGGPW